MCAVSTISAIFVLTLHFHRTTYRPPNWLKNIAFSKVACILCMTDINEANDTETKCFNQSNTKISPEDGNEQLTDELKLVNERKIEEISLENSQNKDLLMKLNAMHSEMKIIIKKIKQEQEETDAADEWKGISMIFDRMLFWIVLILLIVMSIVLMIPGTISNRDRPQ